jgi:hypothetical protein
MDDKTAELEPYTRARLEAAARGLDRRAKLVLPAWIGMLETLENGEISDDFTDWFEIAARKAAITMSVSSATGLIPPFRWPRKCWSRRMAR